MDAIIFDFDGVVVDSEPIHFMAFRKVLTEVGLELTEQDYYSIYLGFDDHDCFAAVMQANSLTFTEDQIARLTENKTKIVKEVIKDKIEPLSGAVELISSAAAEGFPLGICSGALREEIELALQCIGAEKYFKLIIAARDVTHGKPDPEGYLLTLRKLAQLTGREIRSEKCVVIEDSPAGITSAKAAGMKVLAVTNSYPTDALREADMIVRTLAEVSADTLGKLVENPAV